MRKRYIVVLVILIIITTIVIKNQYANNIEDVIIDYYDKSYDMWLSINKGDLSDVLDLNSPQSFNKDIALEKMILNKIILIEQGYIVESEIRKIKKGKIKFVFKDIDIKGNKAVIVFDIEFDGKNAYPAFIHMGENEIFLSKIRGRWKIQKHNYTDTYIYEGDKNKKLDFNRNEYIDMYRFEHPSINIPQ